LALALPCEKGHASESVVAFPRFRWGGHAKLRV
jgi:hypothetical protein